MTRDEAIEIARRCAKAKPQSYYTEPFAPHEWVIDAILAASTSGAQRAVIHWPDCALNHGGGECDMGPECGSLLSLDEIEALRYLKVFAEELHIERMDLHPDHAHTAQTAIVALEKVIGS